MHVVTEDEELLLARLRVALQEGLLEVHAQPVVELPGGTVVGVEALARWTDDELGPVPPDVFVPLAERTGLVRALGRHVLDRACRAAAAWVPAVGPAPSLAVNVSPVQLEDRSVLADVAEALRASGLDPSRLTLEVTETAAITDLDATTSVLEELRALGVRLALDDFGTGWSSLTVLHRLPVDVVKLDRALVSPVASDPRSALIVRLVVDAVHLLGLSVVAEGVETDAQARQLVALGCDSAQGWLFGHPHPDLPVLPRTLRGLPRSGWTFDAGAEAPVPVHGSTDLVARTSPQGEVTYVSTSVRAMLARSPAELLGRAASDLIHPEDRVQPRGVPVRLRLRHRDGSWRWLEARGEELLDASGRVREVLWVARDITDAVGVERALAESEALYRRTFDDAPTGIGLGTLDGRVLRANQALADLLGRSVGDLLGMTVEDLTHPDDHGVDAAGRASIATGDLSRTVLRKRYLRGDGTVVAAQVHVRVLTDLEGEPAYLVAHVLPEPWALPDEPV